MRRIFFRNCSLSCGTPARILRNGGLRQKINLNPGQLFRPFPSHKKYSRRLARADKPEAATFPAHKNLICELSETPAPNAKRSMRRAGSAATISHQADTNLAESQAPAARAKRAKLPPAARAKRQAHCAAPPKIRNLSPLRAARSGGMR